MKSDKITKAINSLTFNGFVLISTDLQIKKGNLMFKDLHQPGVEYAIYNSGYVRKRNVVVDGMEKPWSHCYGGVDTANRWWQLNKVERVTYDNYAGYYVERILTPGDYDGMAQTILRVSMKSRKKYNLNN